MAQFILSDRLVNLHSKICRLQDEVQNRVKAYMPAGTTVVFRFVEAKDFVSGVVVGYKSWNRVIVRSSVPELDEFVFDIAPFDTSQVFLLSVEVPKVKHRLPSIKRKQA